MREYQIRINFSLQCLKIFFYLAADIREETVPEFLNRYLFFSAPARKCLALSSASFFLSLFELKTTQWKAIFPSIFYQFQNRAAAPDFNIIAVGPQAKDLEGAVLGQTNSNFIIALPQFHHCPLSSFVRSRRERLIFISYLRSGFLGITEIRQNRMP